MQKYAYNQLSLTQYIFFIYKTQIGIGVLSLPRELAEIAGSDGWISILIGWLFSILVSVIIIKIMEKHPNDTLFEILPMYFGKWIGNGFSLLWILYAAISASVVLFATIHITQEWILPRTEYLYLLFLFVIPIYMITRHGIKVIGRFAEFVFIITLVMPFLLLFALRDIHWINLLPVAKEGWLPIVMAVKKTNLSFIGFELAFFLYPFLKDKRSAYKGIIIANTLTMLILLMVTIICYIRFSAGGMNKYVWPMLNLLKLIQLPFLERLEILYLSFYLLVLFMSIIPYLYVAVWGTSQLIGKQDHRHCLRIMIVLWIIIACLFEPTFDDVLRAQGWYGQKGLYLAFVFPVLLWMYSQFFFWRKGQKR